MEPYESQRAPASKEQVKKIYQRPELQVYGNLGEVTQTIAGKFSFDGKNNHNTA
jgi:hypothetical protein